MHPVSLPSSYGISLATHATCLRVCYDISYYDVHGSREDSPWRAHEISSTVIVVSMFGNFWQNDIQIPASSRSCSQEHKSKGFPVNVNSPTEPIMLLEHRTSGILKLPYSCTYKLVGSLTSQPVNERRIQCLLYLLSRRMLIHVSCV